MYIQVVSKGVINVYMKIIKSQDIFATTSFFGYGEKNVFLLIIINIDKNMKKIKWEKICSYGIFLDGNKKYIYMYL